MRHRPILKPTWLISCGLLWFFCFLTGSTFAAEKVKPSKVPSEAIQISVKKGKVTGGFIERPVKEILDALAQQGKFKYRGSEELLKKNRSVQFNQASLLEAVRKVLKPFNYTLLENGRGGVQRVDILSLREEASTGLVRTMPTFRQPKTLPPFKRPDHIPPPPTHGLVKLEDMEMTDKQRADFEMAKKKLAPSPEQMDQFYPEQPSGTELTGPPVP